MQESPHSEANVCLSPEYIAREVSREEILWAVGLLCVFLHAVSTAGYVNWKDCETRIETHMGGSCSTAYRQLFTATERTNFVLLLAHHICFYKCCSSIQISYKLHFINVFSSMAFVGPFQLSTNEEFCHVME
jgi:hypothetical protein